ncbi:MAG TPA: STAS domain-containing protein [Chitinispirillaceae bacterium]|nr:STAS domain-containing protein [Chitinispirillaceae bacterium]
MNIRIYPEGIYQVMEVGGQIVISQLDELRHLISGHISNGQTYIALRFSDATYLYSGAIAVLISCFKQVKDIRGDLCLLEPKNEMVDLLKQMGIDRLIPIYSSIDNLPRDHRQIEDLNIKITTG